MAKFTKNNNSEAKQEEVKKITEELENGIKNLFDSNEYTKYLKTLSKFHNYSFGNCFLIARQMPEATRVAGFQSWKTNFNRQVKKGEKAIKILAPIPCKFKTTEENENGEEVEKIINYTRFTTTCVFDISQTEGEELPELVHELNGNIENFEKVFDAVKSASDVPVEMEAITSGAHGYFSPSQKRIAINEGMSESQTIKTTIHEIAHSYLHCEEGEEKEADRNTKEVQAESVAFVVSNYFGFDTSDYSFGYVAGWSKGKELKELKTSLQAIQKTAQTIIDRIEKAIA